MFGSAETSATNLNRDTIDGKSVGHTTQLKHPNSRIGGNELDTERLLESGFWVRQGAAIPLRNGIILVRHSKRGNGLE